MSENAFRDKLAELKGLADKVNVDISRELVELENKLRTSRTPGGGPVENEAWRRVELARHPERPTTLQYAEKIFDDFTELHGDRNYGDDPAMVGGIGLLNGMPVTFFGQQKGQNMKDNLKRALTENLRSCLDAEAEHMVQSAMTNDYLEAVRAFQEKRTPIFRGE